MLKRPPNTGRKRPSLTRLWRFIVRRRLTIVITATAFFAAGTGALYFLPPAYKATSIIMISPIVQPEVTPEATNADVRAKQSQSLDAFIDAHLAFLKSQIVLSTVVDRLNLGADLAWTRGKQKSEVAAKMSAEDALSDAVNIRRRNNSYVVDVTVRANTPQQAAEIANVYTDIYNEQQLRSQNQGAGEERLRALEIEVRRAEDLVAAQRNLMRTAAEIPPPPLESPIPDSPAPPVAQEAPQTAAARADLAAKEARAAQAQTLASAGYSPSRIIPPALQTDGVREAMKLVKEATEKETALKQQFGDSDPAVVQARQSRFAATSALNAELDSIAAKTRKERDAARAVLATLPATAPSIIAQASSARPERAPAIPETGPSTDVSAELASLERNAALAREEFYSAVAASKLPRMQNLEPAAVTEVSRAVAPTRPWINPLDLLGYLAVAASAFGFLIGWVHEALDDTLGGEEDAERKTGRGILGSIPLLRTNHLRQLAPLERHPAGYIVEKPMSPFAESLRTLRTILMYSSTGEPARILCVTSAQPKDGKTSTAFSLARVAALAGQRALLIDASDRDGSVAELLDLSEAPTFREDDWRSGLVPDAETTLDILPISKAENLMKSIQAWKGGGLLESLRSHFDLIVIDAPCMSSGTLARALAREADQTIFVARYRKSTARAVRTAIRVLESDGVRVAGVLLNAVNPRTRGESSFSDAAYQSPGALRYFA